MAELDTRTLRLRIETARARIGVREQVLLRLRNGTRPQEVDQSQGAPAGGTGGSRTGPPGVGAPAADRRWHRRQGRQSAEPGCGRRATEGRQGRSGEPAQGLAARRHRPAGRGHRPGAGRTGGRPGRPEASRALSSQAQLKAPRDATVRTRLLEPGDMASPSRPVFALALTDPKWVRAYVNERQLGRVHPDRRRGWSPTACRSGPSMGGSAISPRLLSSPRRRWRPRT
ncbi:HlyD family efflux transporter periplasmic adaptor subunit [Pseudomonas aeruginosa]|nr:HlyD family efflux transporter periplasmic adaptor subunit [Pseudomonas aeruginosa]